MDNLPNDPPNQNNNPTPPPFGSSFNPHINPVPSGTGTNPQDPNNPYSSQTPVSNPPQNPDPIIEAHRETAEHQPRDSHGRFIPEQPQTSPPSQTTPTPPNPPTTPIPVKITQTNTYSEKYDPPLVDLKVTNPITYLKKWVSKLLKNQDISLHIRIKPFATIGLVLAFAAVGGTSFSVGRYFFPHSSPILHRAVVYQGLFQKTDKGIFLTLPNSDLYTLKPKPKTNIDFKNIQDGQALVKGNLTKEPYVVEVSEVISLGISSSLESPNPPNPPNIPNQDLLPKLYPNLTWEVTQRKVLTFTSGKRRIEQEGVYLESAQVTDYPQSFIDYYTQELQNSGFKQPLNSSGPTGTTITYSKDDLFLTFGIENVYSGTGDNKKLTGYKAYIEHN